MFFIVGLTLQGAKLLWPDAHGRLATDTARGGGYSPTSKHRWCFDVVVFEERRPLAEDWVVLRC